MLRGFIQITVILLSIIIFTNCSNMQIKPNLSGAEYSRTKLVSSTITSAIGKANLAEKLTGKKVYLTTAGTYQGKLINATYEYMSSNNIEIVSNQNNADYALSIYDIEVGANEYYHTFWFHIIYGGYWTKEFDMKASARLGYTLTDLKTNQTSYGEVFSESSNRIVQKDRIIWILFIPIGFSQIDEP